MDARAGGKPDIRPEWKRQRGRPCRRWVQQIEDDTGLNANDAWRITHDRKSWRALWPVAGQAFQRVSDAKKLSVQLSRPKTKPGPLRPRSRQIGPEAKAEKLASRCLVAKAWPWDPHNCFKQQRPSRCLVAKAWPWDPHNCFKQPRLESSLKDLQLMVFYSSGNLLISLKEDS